MNEELFFWGGIPQELVLLSKEGMEWMMEWLVWWLLVWMCGCWMDVGDGNDGMDVWCGMSFVT